MADNLQNHRLGIQAREPFAATNPVLHLLPIDAFSRFKIHDYFTEAGLFDEERFKRHVQSVVKDFESKVR